MSRTIAGVTVETISSSAACSQTPKVSSAIVPKWPER
jgi:hypothetical protein